MDAPFYSAFTNVYRGWALAVQGQSAEGLGQLHHALAAVRATGSKATLAALLGLLAQVYHWNGEAAEGLRVLAEALTLAHKQHEGYAEAERASVTRGTAFSE